MMAPLLLQQHAAALNPGKGRIASAIIAAATSASCCGPHPGPVPAESLQLQLGTELATALPDLIVSQLVSVAACAKGDSCSTEKLKGMGTVELIESFPELLKPIIHTLGLGENLQPVDQVAEAGNLLQVRMQPHPLS